MQLLESVLSGNIPRKDDLSQREFEYLIWGMRGELRSQQRELAFWLATADNFKLAFERLEQKERELEQAYATIRADLAVASQLQQSMLPVPGERMSRELDIAVFHRQLADVGGDYYDFFHTSRGDYAVGVFDISGHGVSAALVMTYLKAQFMAVMEDHTSPADIVRRVNEISLSFLRTIKKYATVIFVEFQHDSLRYVNAGGNGFMAGRHGAVAFSKPDQFLGLRPRPFHEFEIPYLPGDLLALYTDGIMEAQSCTGEDYTKNRINSLILENRQKPVDEITQLCISDYCGFRDQDSDDITLLLIRKKDGKRN